MTYKNIYCVTVIIVFTLFEFVVSCISLLGGIGRISLNGISSPDTITTMVIVEFCINFVMLLCNGVWKFTENKKMERKVTWHFVKSSIITLMLLISTSLWKTEYDSDITPHIDLQNELEDARYHTWKFILGLIVLGTWMILFSAIDNLRVKTKFIYKNLPEKNSHNTRRSNTISDKLDLSGISDNIFG
jgi:amino acid transporter